MLPTEYQSFIHLSRYARWRYDEERRETWSETVGRFFDFFKEDLKEKCSYDLTDEDVERMADQQSQLDKQIERTRNRINSNINP